jgi:hypothetical protein
MRLEVEPGQLRPAAAIAEKAAPYLHAKKAPQSDDGDSDREIIIRVTGGPAGLSERCSRRPPATDAEWQLGEKSTATVRIGRAWTAGGGFVSQPTRAAELKTVIRMLNELSLWPYSFVENLRRGRLMPPTRAALAYYAIAQPEGRLVSAPGANGTDPPALSSVPYPALLGRGGPSWRGSFLPLEHYANFT